MYAESPPTRALPLMLQSPLMQPSAGQFGKKGAPLWWYFQRLCRQGNLRLRSCDKDGHAHAHRYWPRTMRQHICCIYRGYTTPEGGKVTGCIYIQNASIWVICMHMHSINTLLHTHTHRLWFPPTAVRQTEGRGGDEGSQVARAQAVVCIVIPGHERHLDTCICAMAEAGRYVSVHSDTPQSGYLPLGCGGIFFFFFLMQR